MEILRIASQPRGVVSFKQYSCLVPPVIPPKAEIHVQPSADVVLTNWIPAFAGMTYTQRGTRRQMTPLLSEEFA
jgi:hypothetical protein